MADQFCESCEHWCFVYQDGHLKWGTCENSTFKDKIKVTQDFDSIDDTNVLIECNNGCIFHERKEKNLLFKMPKV